MSRTATIIINKAIGQPNSSNVIPCNEKAVYYQSANSYLDTYYIVYIVYTLSVCLYLWQKIVKFIFMFHFGLSNVIHVVEYYSFRSCG